MNKAVSMSNVNLKKFVIPFQYVYPYQTVPGLLIALRRSPILPPPLADLTCPAGTFLP